MEDRDRVLDSRLSSHTLNGLNDNFFRLRVSVQLSLVHNLVDIGSGIGLGLILERLHQAGFCLISAKSRELFELGTLLKLHLLEFLRLNGQQLLLVVDTCLLVVKIILTTAQLLLTLIERHLTLFQTVLALLEMLVALLHLLLEFALLVDELFLHLKQLLLFDNLSLFRGRTNHLVIFSLQYIAENQIATQPSDDECRCNGNDSNNNVHNIIYIVNK